MKKIGIKTGYVLLIILLPLSYLWIQEAFIIFSYVNAMAFRLSDETINTLYTSHFYILDSLMCFGMHYLYFPWYFWIRQKEKNHELRAAHAYLPLKLGLILLMIMGISNLWMYFVSEYLYAGNVLGLGDSLDQFSQTWSMEGDESYLWVYLSVVFLGPWIEELIFRGIQFHYAEKLGKSGFAIIVTAISFGLWHGEPVQIVYTTLMGLVLGIVYDTTKSLAAVVWLHILNNFLSQVLSQFLSEAVIGGFQILSYLAIIPGLIILILMIQAKRRYNACQSPNLSASQSIAGSRLEMD